MNYLKFDEYVSDTINYYKQKLIEDFEVNPAFEKLASVMCLYNFVDENSNAISAKEWLNEINLLTINKKLSIGKAKVIRKYLEYGEIDTINHQFKYIETEKYGLYYFFTNYVYKSIEQLREDDNRYFYLCQDDYVTKLDALFTDTIIGYSKNKKNLFTKKITSNCSLIIDANKKREHFEDVQIYSYPSFYWEFDNKSFPFSNYNDPSVLLFNQLSSFVLFFYGNLNLRNRTGEPVIYHYEQTGEYVLTNTHLNLERFNKFILLTTELLIHYFKIFENWVINFFIPRLELAIKTGDIILENSNAVSKGHADAKAQYLPEPDGETDGEPGNLIFDIECDYAYYPDLGFTFYFKQAVEKKTLLKIEKILNKHITNAYISEIIAAGELEKIEGENQYSGIIDFQNSDYESGIAELLGALKEISKLKEAGIIKKFTID
jgi:hypothetical protein